MGTQLQLHYLQLCRDCTLSTSRTWSTQSYSQLATWNMDWTWHWKRRALDWNSNWCYEDSITTTTTTFRTIQLHCAGTLQRHSVGPKSHWRRNWWTTSNSTNDHSTWTNNKHFNSNRWSTPRGRLFKHNYYHCANSATSTNYHYTICCNSKCWQTKDCSC